MEIKRVAPGFYVFTYKHGLSGTIDRLECGWIVRMDGSMVNYSDPERTYREAKETAEAWAEL